MTTVMYQVFSDGIQIRQVRAISVTDKTVTYIREHDLQRTRGPRSFFFETCEAAVASLLEREEKRLASLQTELGDCQQNIENLQSL